MLNLSPHSGAARKTSAEMVQKSTTGYLNDSRQRIALCGTHTSQIAHLAVSASFLPSRKFPAAHQKRSLPHASQGTHSDLAAPNKLRLRRIQVNSSDNRMTRAKAYMPVQRVQRPPGHLPRNFRLATHEGKEVGSEQTSHDVPNTPDTHRLKED